TGERSPPRLMKSGKSRHRGLPARLSRIKPANIGPGRKLHPRLQDPPDQIVVRTVVAHVASPRKSRLRITKLLNQIIVPLSFAVIGLKTVSSQLQRHRDSSLKNLGKKNAVASRCEIEKYTLAAHLLELLFGCLVAVLDGISAGIDCSLDTGLIDGVDRNLEMVAMRLFDGRGKLRNCEVLIGRNLDDVYVMKHILPDRFPSSVYSVD